MLKVLMLRNDLKLKEEALAKLREASKTLDTRKSQLEIAVSEVKTDEERTAVSAEIDTYEAERTANSDAIKAAESEIEAIRTKITEEEAAQTPPPTTERSNHMPIENVRDFFALTYEQRCAFVARDDVKNFLAELRTVCREKRGVTGVSLTFPASAANMLVERIAKYSKVLPYTNCKAVKGELRQMVLGTIPEAIWTEATGAITELDLSFNRASVDNFKLSALVPVPNSDLDDSDVNLFEVVFDALAKSFAKGADRGFLYGTKIRMPLGVVTRLAQTAKPADYDDKMPTWVDLHSTNISKASSNSLTGDQLIAEYAAFVGVLEPGYSNGKLVHFMNRKTRAKIVTRLAHYNDAGAVVAIIGNQMPVIGGDIVEVDGIADNNIIVGYFDNYLVGLHRDATLTMSDQARFVEDETVFKGVMRADGKPVIAAAFGLFSITTTDATTTVTFAKDKANPRLCYLDSFKIGAAGSELVLSPAFNPAITNYYATAAAKTQKLTAVVKETGASCVIKNGATTVASGANATLTAASTNVITATVSNGNAEPLVYTFTVECTAVS